MSKYIFLVIIAILSILNKNKIMLYASVTLIILMILPYKDNNLLLSKKYGIKLGLYFLTLAVLTPIAMGAININDLIKSFMDYKTIIPIIMGIIASILSAKGIQMQILNPQVVIAISLGTIIGSVLFKGTASGPLIASGSTYIILQILEKIKR